MSAVPARVLPSPAGLPQSPDRPSLLGAPRDLTPETMVVVTVAGAVLVGVGAGFGALVGLTAIAAVAGAITVLRYPVLGALLLVAAVPVLSGIRRGVPVPGLRLSEAIVVFAAILVLVPAYRRETQPWKAMDWLAFLYAAGSLVIPFAHLVARGEAPTLAAMGSMFLPLQFFLLYRAVRTALPEEHQRAFAVRLLLIGSVVVSAIAAVQQLNIGPARDIVQRFTASEALDSYSYEVYARATGPFQHWHPLAGYLAVIILLCVALLLDDRQRIFGKRALIAILSVNIAALMLSVTFVSMFGVLVGAAMLGIWAGRLRKALKWSAVGAAVAMLFFGSFVVTRIENQYADGQGGTRNSLVPQTVERRIEVWREEYIPGLGGRWASGYGPDLPPDVRWTHTESLYVTVLLRGGLPLLALFAFSMLALSKTARARAADAATRPMARTVVVLVAVLWVMHLLFPYMTSSGLPQPFWALVGITLAGWQTGRMRTRVSNER